MTDLTRIVLRPGGAELVSMAGEARDPWPRRFTADELRRIAARIAGHREQVILSMAHPAGRPLLAQRLGVSADLEGSARHVPKDGDVRAQCRDERGGQTMSSERVQVA